MTSNVTNRPKLTNGVPNEIFNSADFAESSSDDKYLKKSRLSKKTIELTKRFKVSTQINSKISDAINDAINDLSKKEEP